MGLGGTSLKKVGGDCVGIFEGVGKMQEQNAWIEANGYFCHGQSIEGIPRNRCQRRGVEIRLN